VDRIDNWRYGAFGIWLEAGGVAVESANGSRGERPWVPHPVSARERARAHSVEQSKTSRQADAPD
jgi:hypothetical protein